MYDYSVEGLESVHTPQHFGLGGLGWSRSESKPNMEHLIDELLKSEPFQHKIHHYIKSEFSEHLETLTKEIEKNSSQITAIKELETKLKELLTQLLQKEPKVG